eukprot:PhF_6_TR23802/c0_g1_i1/m.33323
MYFLSYVFLIVVLLFDQLASQTLHIQDGLTYSGKLTSYSSISDPVNMSSYKVPVYTVGMCSGGVLASSNKYVILVPYGFTYIVRLDLMTGAFTTYNKWPATFVVPSSNAFVGGVYDGVDVWLIPHNADRIVKVNPDTGVTALETNAWPSSPFVLTSGAFYGGIFDGSSVWLVPYNANRVVKCSSIAMNSFGTWPSGFVAGTQMFAGGVFDGSAMWMIPYNADRIVTIQIAGGSMRGFNAWPSGYTKVSGAFSGGSFDGRYLWTVPHNADMVLKVDTLSVPTTTMTGYNSWPQGFVNSGQLFVGGISDGTWMWMVPHSASDVVKIHLQNGTMGRYYQWPSEITYSVKMFFGGVYNGSEILLFPHYSDRIVRIKNSTTPLSIYNHDGLGFSGKLSSYSILSDPIQMISHNMWPGGVTVSSGGLSFAGGVSIINNQYIILVPHHINSVV